MKDLTDFVFKPEFITANCDLNNGKYMACSLMYRGNVKTEEVSKALS